MSQKFRKSSRGNPWRWPAGTPRGGQFAPKGTEGAAIAVCGMYFADKEAFDSYKENGTYESDSDKFYGGKTASRFNQEPTEAQIKQAERIKKALAREGLEPGYPEGGTKRAYDEYINENKYDAMLATEKQARTIRHLQDNLGIQYSSDDKYGGSAGDFVGKSINAEKLSKRENWEKDKDGCYYARTHDLKKDGTPGTQNLGYRLKPFKDDSGKTRYRVQRSIRTGEKDANGKEIKTYQDADRADMTVRGTSWASDVKEGAKIAATHEVRRYAVYNHQTTRGKKYAVRGVKNAVSHMEKMGDESNWSVKGDALKYEFNHDANNHYSFTVEEGTIGYHAFRDVTNVQTVRKYDKKTGQMYIAKVPHTRREWVGTTFATKGEAVKACQKHEANSIVNQRFATKVSGKMIKDMKDRGEIKSEKEYNKLLDSARKLAK